MNNKGFTLIETLAVIALLGIVLSIGGYSIASYLRNSREKSLFIFKENVKSGIINYYNECKYMRTDVCDSFDLTNVSDENDSNKIIGYQITTTVGKLVEYGFLENQGDEGEMLEIKNPVNEEEDLTYCQVSITYYTDKYSEAEKRQKFDEVVFGDKCHSLRNDNN